MSENQWRQESPDYWLCLYWDVWREWGCWHVSFVYGRRIPRDFETAEKAMAYVDGLKQE